MLVKDFLRRFTRARPKSRPALLHDLNRLGLVRIVQGTGPDFAVQAIEPIDFDSLLRTLCDD